VVAVGAAAAASVQAEPDLVRWFSIAHGSGLRGGDLAVENGSHMDEPISARRSELRRSLSEASHRIESIIDAAEQAAEEIRTEAREEAETYLRARREEADELVAQRSSEIADVVARVVDRAEQLRGEADAILGELRNGTPIPSPSPAPADPQMAPSPVQAVPLAPRQGADPGTTPPDAESAVRNAPGSDVPEEALLRATQMAVAGHERAEIERVLVAEFAVVDVQAVLDEILGPAAR
jgi:hypothetical protein